MSDTAINVPVSVIRSLPPSALGRLFAKRVVDLLNDGAEGLIGDWVADLDEETFVAIFDESKSAAATPAKTIPKRKRTPRTTPAPAPVAHSVEPEPVAEQVESAEDVDADDEDDSPSSGPAPSGAAHDALMAALRARPSGASTEELRAALDATPGSVKGLLKRAKDAGLIRIEGTRRSARYFALVANGEAA